MNAVFTKVLNMSLTASIVILVVLAARLFLKKAPKVISYALWAVVLFRLLCPVSLMAPVSVLESAQPAVTITSPRTSSVSYLPAPAPDIPTPEAPLSEKSPKIAVMSPPAGTGGIWAGRIWLTGTAILLLHCLVSYLRLRRRLMDAVVYRGRIYLADRIPTPFVMGILKPRIYLPSGTPEGELPYILAHEEHHIRRFDHIFKLLAYGALCIHWFNPLVWLSFLLAGKDMEMSCDEAVIRKLGPEIRAEYAGSLLRLAAGRPVIAGIPLAFGDGDTKGRVKNMAKWKKPKLWAVIPSVLLCAAILVACAVNPGKKEEPSAETAVPVAGEEAASLGKCRTALENLQNKDSYNLQIQRYNYGDYFLNDSSSSIYCQDGENWVMVHRIPDEGFARGYGQFGYLCVDGAYYNNEQTGWDENEEILWGQAAENPSVKPWIATFQWDAQEIHFVSSVPAGKGQCITLQVMAPYNAESEDAYDYYHVQFVFNGQGVLERLENTVFFNHTYDYSSTETIEIFSDSASATIDYYYQQYRNQM